MEFPQETKKVINREIPNSLIKERSGGRNVVLRYISGNTVIDLLNEALDYWWDWEAEQEWIQESIPKFNPRYDKEPVPQGPVAHVRGKLTLYITMPDGRCRTIKKTGYGSKAIIGGQSEQADIFKAADTDALKKAASRLGIGLELYRDEEEQLYHIERNYVDPWTDEALEKFASEKKFIEDFMETYDLTEEDINQYVREFNDSLSDIGDITPDNIEQFVAYLKKVEEEARKEENN